MLITFEISGIVFTADTTVAHDISIPMDFSGAQPNSYDIPPSTSQPWQQDGWIGDTRRGGSCNFDEVRLVPHCNGTHTECVGHISLERLPITATLKETLIPATLISVRPQAAKHTNDSYTPLLDPSDLVIDRSALEAGIAGIRAGFERGLVIRTLPNDASKLTRRYASQPAPFFTREAMEHIVSLGVEHLLVDIPSLDRSHDEGLLTAHHIYWGVPERSHEVDPRRHSLKTVTEFIYVPDDITDGAYLLNLQIAPFVLDAAPSRPILIPVSGAN